MTLRHTKRPRPTLTPVEAETLAFYRDYHATRSFPPSLSEAADELRLSKAGVLKILKRLAHKGRIRLYPKAARGVQLLDSLET